MDVFLLLSYIVYIPVFLFILIFVETNYKGYSAYTNWVSDLGNRKSPYRKLFGFSVAAFGFLSLFFIRKFIFLLPLTGFSYIGVGFLLLTSISCMSAAFVTRCKPKLHKAVSYIVFAGILGASLFLMYPIAVSSYIPNNFVFINILIALTSLALMLVMAHEKEKRLKGFVFKNKGFWEWITFVLAILWYFVMASLTLMYMVV